MNEDLHTMAEQPEIVRFVVKRLVVTPEQSAIRDGSSLSPEAEAELRDLRSEIREALSVQLQVTRTGGVQASLADFTGR